MRASKWLLVMVDAGLVIYWMAVLADVIPTEQAFRDYANPVVQAWNWSFFPLDILAAILGFVGVYLTRRTNPLGEIVLTAGLTLTFCAGFMAISFWAYYGDFNLAWWVPNGFLMAIPLAVLFFMSRTWDRRRKTFGEGDES